MDGSQQEGSGFVYPMGGENTLYIGSLWVGLDSTYVVNNDYLDDPSCEWEVSSDPDGHIVIEENGTSHQDIHASFTDTGAGGTGDLLVYQDSWAWGYPDPADDLVVMNYVVENRGVTSLSELYVGVFLDIDIGLSTGNEGAVDPELGLAYISDPSGIYAGVVAVESSAPVPIANLTLFDNATYVWPNAHVLDADKYAFLAASDPEHILTVSPEPADYSVLASFGPIELGPGDTMPLAFAILGATNLAELEQSARVVHQIMGGGWAAVDDEVTGPDGRPTFMATRLLPSSPNPFRGATAVRFELARTAEVSVGIFDITGRRVRVLADGLRGGGRHTLSWDGRDDSGRALSDGIYFLRLSTAGARQSRPIVLLR
jgi:hypothetical protein